MQQLGELQKSADAIRQLAGLYVINVDTPEDSQQLTQITQISVPVLLDRQLTVTRQYDMLVKPGQPMGGMRGVPQTSPLAAGTFRAPTTSHWERCSPRGSAGCFRPTSRWSSA